MRLVSIELSGFRGFPLQREFDLDADSVVVVGANGHGKTSLFDGILWALSGKIPRLGVDDSRLVSLYSESGQARVALRLRNPATTETYSVTRSFDGKEGRLSLQTSAGIFHGPSAEGKLIDLIWPDAASATDSREALATVLTRSVYLQQDLIRQFVEAASNHDRFTAVSELVGAGRVTELQASLERSKRAWSTATNQKQDELRPIRERLMVIEARLAELKARSSESLPAVTPEAWTDWWQRLSGLGLKAVPTEQSSRQAPAAIDNAMKQLDGLRRAAERRSQNLAAMKVELAALAIGPTPDLLPLQQQVATTKKQLEDLKVAASTEQARLTEMRRSQAELKEKTEQLKTLAVLALKLLGDRCPVCRQTYDVAETKSRLESLAVGAPGEPVTAKPVPDQLGEILQRIASKEREVVDSEVALRSAESERNQRMMREQAISKRLTEIRELEGAAELNATLIEQLLETTNGSLTKMADLQRTGESLALRLAEASSVAAIAELNMEVATLRKENVERDKAISARNSTGELAQKVIEALRDSGSEVVAARLTEITPLLQSIWARIDPHPAFRLVSFFSQFVRGKGQLSTVLSDELEGKECDVPGSILSSSQLNALAVSVFLALNLGIPQLPLAIAILDDPLQSLDDINLLGLVDLFRQTKDRRQLFVSTHSSKFGNLLSRKLRPATKDGRTIIIDLEGWSRQGPSSVTREVNSDPVPLRLVS